MNDAPNPFEAYGEASTRTRDRKPRGPKIVMSEKDAPMVPNEMEKQQRERSAQMARYRKHKRDEHQQMIVGTHGDAYYRMLKIMAKLPASSAELVDHLQKGWVKQLNAHERQTVLGMISRRIMLIRERDGRPTFDDPMPGEPDNLFIICRKKIMGH